MHTTKQYHHYHVLCQHSKLVPCHAKDLRKTYIKTTQWHCHTYIKTYLKQDKHSNCNNTKNSSSIHDNSRAYYLAHIFNHDLKPKTNHIIQSWYAIQNIHSSSQCNALHTYISQTHMPNNICITLQIYFNHGCNAYIHTMNSITTQQSPK